MWLSGKISTCQYRRPGFSPWVRRIPWRRKWQPTPVFLPGESYGPRNLVGCSPQGHKELVTTKATQHACTIHLQPLLFGRSDNSQLKDYILESIFPKETFSLRKRICLSLLQILQRYVLQLASLSSRYVIHCYVHHGTAPSLASSAVWLQVCSS